MNLKFTITLGLLLVSKLFYGQDCNCESNFLWMKKTFEENDAGYQYIINKKGQQAYDIHNIIVMDKVKSVQSLSECTKTLYEWLKFFRLEHVGVGQLKSDNTTNDNSTPVETFQDSGIDIPAFEKYITSKNEPGYEGIWETGAYKIGIKKEGHNYTGFIISSEAPQWTEGKIKLRINENDGKMTSVFYMRDHTAVKSEDVMLLGNNYLKLGYTTLKRTAPYFPAEKEFDSYVKFLSEYKPYLEEIDETTLLLRIPSFDMSEKKHIDSLVLSNKDKILRTKNLIIDLRYNGGGGDSSYDEIIPLLYTNPIRIAGVEFLSTKLNNQSFLQFIEDYGEDLGEEEKETFRNYYNKLEERPGEFVNIFEDEIFIEELDTVYPYPQNIGVLINDYCYSATEQFLLAAKQSKKVKLFGTTTGGALDVSNLHDVESPCNEFKLVYSTSRSYRIPDMVIDDIGIQPDFFIDKTIPDHKWVEHVKEILGR